MNAFCGYKGMACGALIIAIAAGLPAGLMAQERITQGVGPWGPQAGNWEVTLGGSGSNDRDFDVGSFGLSGSVGYYLTRNSEISLRQSMNYADFGDHNFNGSTRLAYDYHFDFKAIRPFVGVNVGGNYGDTVADTFASGLEAGVKWYVKQQTFLFVIGEYQWLFEDADKVEDKFDEGQFLYTVGIGFNF